jgi:hypothetical protein
MGLVECLILLVVLGVSLASVLTTMEWGSRSYAFAREDINERVLIFDWCQSFESFYPGITEDVGDACKWTTEFLGGTWSGNTATLRALRFQVDPLSNADGILVLNMKVFRRRGGAADFAFERRFNKHSSETVSDDVI